MNHFDHLRETFALEYLPANIRAMQFLARWPVLRRYQRIPVGLPFLPAEGRFHYQFAGQRRLIKFDGRNLQFHALYEERFRYGYELETALLVSSLCRGSAPFFDIGSNWGYFSLLVATLAEFTGPIYAFEPNPRTFSDLTSTIEQAGVAARVQACHFGLGREECEMTVMEPDRFNTGLSHLTARGDGRTVPVKPIDALNFGAPGMIKIDAEGMELEVLAGATRTLREAKPFVVFENFLDFEEPQKTYATLNFLEEYGYRLFMPVLEFSLDGAAWLMTYGLNYTPVIERGGVPRLGVVEASVRHRFLMGQHLNLLGVHRSRVEELWKAGIADMRQI